MAKRKYGGKRDSDGLTARQRAFVLERRKDWTASNAEIAKRAGFVGDYLHLAERARVLMRMPKIAMAVHAPAPGKETKTNQKTELRRRLLLIIRNERTPDAKKIRAIDKLLATIPGAYVPEQVNSRGHLTMEAIARAMHQGRR